MVTNGTFIMYDGKISGNKAKRAGGVFLTGTSRFIMEGGSIENNETNNSGPTEYGGGLRVSGASSVEMKGGSITGNKILRGTTAGSGGGGVAMDSTGSFIMSGNALIANNSAGVTLTSAGGGGVRLDRGTFEVIGTGAKIENNLRQGVPNNVYKTGGTFIFRGSPRPDGVHNDTP